MERAELDELLGAVPGAGDPVATEPTVAEAEVIETPAEEAVEESVADVAEEVVAVETAADSKSEPAEEELEEIPLDQLTPRERALMERLERVTGEKLATVPVETARETQAEVAPVDHNFLEGMDIDEVLSTPENFNKLLLSVYNKGLQEAGRLAAENIMRSLPSTINTFVNQQLTMRETVQQFYNDNPELRNVKKIVAGVANEIAAEHPEYELGKLMNEASSRVYKMLGLKKGAMKKGGNGTTSGKPAFVRQRSGSERVRADTPGATLLETEIAELLVE